METEAVSALNKFGEQSGLTQLIAEYAWICVIAFVLLLLKGTLENAVEGLGVFFGGEYREDDIVILDGRPGRRARVGVMKTVFYLYSFREGKVVGGTKLAVENSSLASMRIEKPLSKLDSADFFKADEGPNGDSGGGH